MVRRYDDPVDVRRHDEQPGQFLWRGRLYVVRSVLAHWVEAGRWWCAPSARAIYAADVTGDAPPEASSDEPAAESAVEPAPASFAGPGAGPGAESAGGPGVTGVDDGEREIWRVEAASGRSAGAGVYDLCFDWSAGAWTLLRSLD